MSQEQALILYGTQTGTAEDLATELHEGLGERGVNSTLKNMFDTKVAEIANFQHVYVIVSTWGDGDPPDDAEDFCEGLEDAADSSLAGFQFAVFGLGDTGYDEFCACGKLLDRELERAGGQRILPRVDCDVDIDEPFERWERDVYTLWSALTTMCE